MYMRVFTSSKQYDTHLLGLTSRPIKISTSVINSRLGGHLSSEREVREDLRKAESCLTFLRELRPIA